MSSVNATSVMLYIVVTLGIFFVLRYAVLPWFGVTDLVGFAIAIVPALLAGRFVRSYYEARGGKTEG